MNSITIFDVQVMNDAQVPVLDPAPLTGLNADDALWYKDAVIYQVNVKSF